MNDTPERLLARSALAGLAQDEPSARARLEHLPLAAFDPPTAPERRTNVYVVRDLAISTEREGDAWLANDEDSERWAEGTTEAGAIGALVKILSATPTEPLKSSYSGPSEEILRLADLRMLAGVAADGEVERFRLTAGEPIFRVLDGYGFRGVAPLPAGADGQAWLEDGTMTKGQVVEVKMEGDGKPLLRDPWTANYGCSEGHQWTDTELRHGHRLDPVKGSTPHEFPRTATTDHPFAELGEKDRVPNELLNFEEEGRRLRCVVAATYRQWALKALADRWIPGEPPP